MKHQMTPKSLDLSSILIAVLILIIGGAFMPACSKADATEKKTKSKTSKSKPEPVDDEVTEETTEESQPETAAKDSEPVPESNTTSNKSIKKDLKEKDKKSDKKVESGPVKSKSTVGESVWNELVKGNKRFMSGKHSSVDYAAARQKLVKGQQPEAIILGCADSRVPPEFVFDRNLGQLFVIRNAGNIVDKMALGSIEYAVEHLHSKVLIILGHESCGAVAATVSGEKMPSLNLTAIVDGISPAFEGSKTCKIGGESNLSCIELSVHGTSKNMLAKSPIIRKAVEDSELLIIRAVYKMATGEIVRLD